MCLHLPQFVCCLTTNMAAVLCLLILFFIVPYYLANNSVHFNDTEYGDPSVFIDHDIELPPFASADSLESLVLEAVRIAGTEVCSSPFARQVMRGTYRNDTPTPEELETSILLRRTCIHELRREDFQPPEQHVNGLRTLHSYDTAPDANNTADIDFHLLPKPPAPPLRTLIPGLPSKSRAAADSSAVNGRNQPPDEATLQLMKTIIKDKSADCKPRKVPVEIPAENGITWLPKCTMVERCGGCCPHNGLTLCVPAPGGITTVKKKVVATSTKGTLIGIREVKTEKHTKCECGCKVKETDCDKDIQRYEAKNCRCVCKQSSTCYPPTYWDERTCKCRCPDHMQTECSTGAYFDSSTCRCATIHEIMKLESARRMNQQQEKYN